MRLEKGRTKKRGEVKAFFTQKNYVYNKPNKPKINHTIISFIPNQCKLIYSDRKQIWDGLDRVGRSKKEVQGRFSTGGELPLNYDDGFGGVYMSHYSNDAL